MRWPAEKESEDHEDVYVMMIVAAPPPEEQQQLRLDMKYLEKPGIFDGREATWSDWKFRMLNCLARWTR